MKLRALLIAGAALAAVSGTAAASGVNWSVSIGIPAPVYAAPAPVYVAPPVAYPPVAVYPPAPVYYYPPRVVYAPAPYYGYGWGERGWRGHERREHGRGWR